MVDTNKKNENGLVDNGICIIPRVLYIVPMTKNKYITNLILTFIICMSVVIKIILLYDSFFKKIVTILLGFTIFFVLVYHSIEYILTGKSIAQLDAYGRVYKGMEAFISFLFWLLPVILIIYGT